MESIISEINKYIANENLLKDEIFRLRKMIVECNDTIQEQQETMKNSYKYLKKGKRSKDQLKTGDMKQYQHDVYIKKKERLRQAKIKEQEELEREYELLQLEEQQEQEEEKKKKKFTEEVPPRQVIRLKRLKKEPVQSSL